MHWQIGETPIERQKTAPWGSKVLSRLSADLRAHLYLREGAAPSNFPHALERTDSELAQQITKDPFTLEFLAIDGDAAERQLENWLVERIIDTLRELGHGSAFVGCQVHFDVAGDDFFVDCCSSISTSFETWSSSSRPRNPTRATPVNSVSMSPSSSTTTPRSRCNPLVNSFTGNPPRFPSRKLNW